MNSRERLVDLLCSMGAGMISSAAYDTAWLARLGDISPDLSEPALEWLRANQLPDGSWGASDLEYHHERLICTVSAINALARYGNPSDARRVERGQATLGRWMSGFVNDYAGATIGFELLIPTLLDEAKGLGMLNGNVNHVLYEYAAQRVVKLSRLPDKAINRNVTVAFSSELVGLGGMGLLDIDHLQEANGSVAYSPAATAFFALHVRPGDPAALSYLHHVAQDGGAPTITPIDIFEICWTLWNVLQAGPPDDDLRALAQPHLDALEAAWWDGQGAGSCSGLSLIDGDDTAVVTEVLARFGRRIDLDAIRHYEGEDHFICFPMEANPSISTNIHILGALRAAGFEAEHPTVKKVLTFLRHSKRNGTYWFDKWHASPYYPTSHAVIAMIGYDDALAEQAIRWIVETQAPDGSWGFFTPTAEETTYCVQALLAWKRHANTVPDGVIEKGVQWLAEHSEPPYPMLWIGKSLYCPREVVRGAILSTLYCAEQERIAL